MPSNPICCVFCPPTSVCVSLAGTNNCGDEVDPPGAERHCLEGELTDDWTVQEEFIGINNHGIPIVWGMIYRNDEFVLQSLLQYHEGTVTVSSVEINPLCKDGPMSTPCPP